MKRGLSLPWLNPAGRVALKRWDVTVFKLPEEPEVRYIKRLVGMPNEVLRIEGGDLWVRRPNQPAEFERLLRPLEHQQAMQMMVYDDAHRAMALNTDSRWLRWTPAAHGDWTEPAPGQFVPSERSSDWTELRYHHLVPSPQQWNAIRSGDALPGAPRATLITDYNSYNTDLLADDLKHPRRAARAWFQPHWVGDLTLSLGLTVREPAGQLRLELIKSGRPYRCEIDLATGDARLFQAETALGPAVRTEINHKGTYQLTFANVDQRLTLWVDGSLPFGAGQTYDLDGPPQPPGAADLEAARIASRQAPIAVEHLVLKRDVYYTIEPTETDYANLEESEQTNSAALPRPPFGPRGSPCSRGTRLATTRSGRATISCWAITAPGAATREPGAAPTRSIRKSQGSAGTIPTAKAGRFPSRC